MGKQEEYEEKIPGIYGAFPTLRQTERKMMRITGSFSRGLASVSVKISCLAHLSEERAVLALTPDPSKAASTAARHSHATGGKEGGGGHARRLDKERWNLVVRLTSFFDPCKLLVV